MSLTKALSIGCFSLSLGLGAAMSSASADGMPGASYAPGAWSWSGFYLGAQVGGGWSDTRYDLIGNATSFDFRGSGAFGGGYGGYNYQLGSLVAGVEIEGSFANIDKSGVTCTVAQTALCSSSINSFGSVRGRIGVAVDRMLIYGAGGWAIADVDFDRKYQPGGVPFTSGVNDTRTGWVLGGGLEYAFSKNWIGRIQYDHYDFGRETYPVPALSNVFDTRVRLDVDTVRVGLSYKLGREENRYQPLK